MNSHLIIRICRHTLPDGRHCQGPAVRGRRCCRHHRGTRTRLASTTWPALVALPASLGFACP